MTISSTVRIAGPYIGSGAATVFPFAFKVFAAAEMQVAKLNTTSNVETILVLTTDYTVQLNGDQNGTPGGTITLPAVLASGYNLTITSDIANLQPTDLTNQGGFYPEVITDALDRATIQIQQLDQNSRAIKIPLSDGVLDMTTPVVAARQGKYLAFDSLGLPVVSSGTGSDSALRTDLANATAVSAGSRLSGFRQTGTGATARTVDAKLKETVSVTDFGAVGDGVTDDTAAIQAALNASSNIYLPSGTYKTTAPLLLNSNNIITGAGISSVIKNTTNLSVIKSITPTGSRIYFVGGSNFKIEGNTAGVVVGSIGLDMQNVTYATWSNVWVNYIATAIKHGNGYSSYYNTYYSCIITSCTNGIVNSQLGNENRFIAIRIDATTGTSDTDCSCNSYIACAIEQFTTGHLITGAAALAIRYIGSRLESTVGAAVGISINNNAEQTSIVSPYFVSTATPIVDNSITGTSILSTDILKLNSGTTAEKHVLTKVVKSIAPLAANTFRQESFTVNLGGLANRHSVNFTAPISFPVAIIAGPVLNGGSGVVYVALYNTSAVTVNFTASETYLFDVWQYA